MEERTRLLGESLKGLLEEGKMSASLALLDGLQPADAAEVLETLPYDDRLRIFKVWDVEESADALPEMSEGGQVEVMQGLARSLATRIISEMPPDDAVDLLADLPDKTSDGILASMSPFKAGQLRRLMAHGEDTAGGLMTPDAMRLSQEMRVGQVLERLREAPESVEMIYYVYFQDEASRLTGVSSLRELIVADLNRPVKEIMHGQLMTVAPEEDQERVAALIDRYDLLAIPVVDGEDRLLGIVTVDDVMDVLEEEAKEDIYGLAGTFEIEEQKERHPFIGVLLGRLPWVLIALTIELLVAGGILRAFSGRIRDNIALVFFIPVILTIGATVSLQSATRMTVEITTDPGKRRRFRRSIAGEALIGLGIGVLSGVVISLFAWSMKGDARLGWVVGLALVIATMFSALVGSLLPLLLKMSGRDPAMASEPFLTTLMDVLGLAVYFLIGIALL
ncbi:MAG: magnesium transporter [Candidatus Solincola sediminis]|uniref:Magnesium transporter MgtE n=1 Tax=Candidatus Solincola sediminis TaxID=1797199 RepID=A0A1F2WPY1_9ACTN|nr:MAG: magnesium transporter [Candidatus Solincola sediminis]